MIGIDHLRSALDQIHSAALLGEGWSGALNTLANAAGARGVTIIRNRRKRLVAALVSDGVREPVEAYLAGKAPPNSRQNRVSHDGESGFRVDAQDYSLSDIAADPFYQEYLRPLGLLWHANARLEMENSDELAISFKRDFARGSYEKADAQVLDRLLPGLVAATRVAESVFDAETRGIVKALNKRDRPIIEFDAWGRVRQAHGRFDGTDGPLSIIGNRVVVADPASRQAFETSLLQATRPPRRPSNALVVDDLGRRFILQFLPVTGAARDVFLVTAAVCVVIERQAQQTLTIDRGLAIDLFKFTLREAHVVALLCGGGSVNQISNALGVEPGTIRFHLKSIFEKTGTGRQAELVALFAQLQG